MVAITKSTVAGEYGGRKVQYGGRTACMFKPRLKSNITRNIYCPFCNFSVITECKSRDGI